MAADGAASAAEAAKTRETTAVKNFIMRIKMVLKSDYRVGYARRFVVSLEDAENCNTPACLYMEDR